MGKNFKGIESENSNIDGWPNTNTKMRVSRELSRSELPKCNEQKDIRDKVVSGNPFTGSAVKRRNSELKGKNWSGSEAASDENLHSDTTQPMQSGKIGKAPQAKDEFSISGKKRNDIEKKTAEFDGVKSNRQLNS